VSAVAILARDADPIIEPDGVHTCRDVLGDPYVAAPVQSDDPAIGEEHSDGDSGAPAPVGCEGTNRQLRRCPPDRSAATLAPVTRMEPSLGDVPWMTPVGAVSSATGIPDRTWARSAIRAKIGLSRTRSVNIEPVP